jgi:hypothetical protein
MRDIVVLLQMATMLILGYLFFKDGNWQFSVAQFCYVIATFFLFIMAPDGK